MPSLPVNRVITLDMRAYRESSKAILPWDVEARLREIEFPALVLASV